MYLEHDPFIRYVLQITSPILWVDNYLLKNQDISSPFLTYRLCDIGAFTYFIKFFFINKMRL